MQKIVSKTQTIGSDTNSGEIALEVDEGMGVASFKFELDFSNDLPVSVDSVSAFNAGYDFVLKSTNGVTPGVLGVGTKFDIVTNTTKVVCSGWVNIISSYSLNQKFMNTTGDWNNFKLILHVVAIGQ